MDVLSGGEKQRMAVSTPDSTVLDDRSQLILVYELCLVTIPGYRSLHFDYLACVCLFCDLKSPF